VQTIQASWELGKPLLAGSKRLADKIHGKKPKFGGKRERPRQSAWKRGEANTTKKKNINHAMSKKKKREKVEGKRTGQRSLTHNRPVFGRRKKEVGTKQHPPVGPENKRIGMKKRSGWHQ